MATLNLGFDYTKYFTPPPGAVPVDKLFASKFRHDKYREDGTKQLELVLKGKAAKLTDLLVENGAPYIGSSGKQPGLVYQVAQVNCTTSNGDVVSIADATMSTVEKTVSFQIGREKARNIEYCEYNSLKCVPDFSQKTIAVLQDSNRNVKDCCRIMGWESTLKRAESRRDDAELNEDFVRFVVEIAARQVVQANYSERLWNGWCTYYHSLIVQEYGIVGPRVSSLIPTKYKMIRSTDIQGLIAAGELSVRTEFLYVGGVENLEYIALCLILVYGVSRCGFDPGTRSAWAGCVSPRVITNVVLVGNQSRDVEIPIEVFSEVLRKPNCCWGYFFNYCMSMGLLEAMNEMAPIAAVAPFMDGDVVKVPFTKMQCKADMFPHMLQNRNETTAIDAPMEGTRIAVAAINMLRKFAFGYVLRAMNGVKTSLAGSGREVDVLIKYLGSTENRVTTARAIGAEVCGLSAHILGQIDILRSLETPVAQIWLGYFMYDSYLLTEVRTIPSVPLADIRNEGVSYDMNVARFNSSSRNEYVCYTIGAYMSQDMPLQLEQCLTHEDVLAARLHALAGASGTGKFRMHLIMYDTSTTTELPHPKIEVTKLHTATLRWENKAQQEPVPHRYMMASPSGAPAGVGGKKAGVRVVAPGDRPVRPPTPPPPIDRATEDAVGTSVYIPPKSHITSDTTDVRIFGTTQAVLKRRVGRRGETTWLPVDAPSVDELRNLGAKLIVELPPPGSDEPIVGSYRKDVWSLGSKQIVWTSDIFFRWGGIGLSRTPGLIVASDRVYYVEWTKGARKKISEALLGVESANQKMKKRLDHSSTGSPSHRRTASATATALLGQDINTRSGVIYKAGRHKALDVVWSTSYTPGWRDWLEDDH